MMARLSPAVSLCAPALFSLLAACSDASHGAAPRRAPDCARSGDCDGRELWSLAITPDGVDPPVLTLARATLGDGVGATFYGRPGAGLDGEALLSASSLPNANDEGASLYLRISGDAQVRGQTSLPSLDLGPGSVTADAFSVGSAETVFVMEAASRVVAYDARGRRRWSHMSERGLGAISADDQGGVTVSDLDSDSCTKPYAARLTRLEADGSTAFSLCLSYVIVAHLAPLPAGGAVALASVGARANHIVPAVTSADFGGGQQRDVEPDGTVLVAWDAQGEVAFVTPIDTPALSIAFDQTLAVGAGGDIWVLVPDRERDEEAWYRFDQHGVRQASGSLSFQVGSPTIVVDSAGYAVISGGRKDSDRGSMLKLSPAGDVVWEKAGLMPNQLAVDLAGSIYAVIDGPKLAKFAP